MSEIITCPSGLSGRIRGMKVREEHVLADRKLAKNGGQVDELLAACWEETLDPGPYDFGDITASERSEETGRESEGRVRRTALATGTRCRTCKPCSSPAATTG